MKVYVVCIKTREVTSELIRGMRRKTTKTVIENELSSCVIQ